MSLRLLRATALIAVIGGAVGSIGLMLRAGQRQQSKILIGLFTIWILSPFVGLVVANIVSKRWPVITRAALYGAMLVVSLGSLGIYADDTLRHRRAQAAFVYVVVPPASWLLTAIVLLMAAFISRRRDGA